MISEHHFIGAIDGDSPDQDIDPRWVNDARNVVWRGQDGRFRAESAVSTVQIVNPFLPATGVNKCICLFYDEVNQQLYDFNFNSLGSSGIYIFNTLTQVWFRLIEVGINTVGDPLGFTANGRIQGPCLIYGDSTDGNLLFFLNSFGVPTKINVNKYLNTPPVNIQRSFIDVIKAPPIVPPRVVYENDLTVAANNLTNSLFQFAYSYLYEDFEESVISSGSIVPLPSVPFSNTKNTDRSICSRIPVYMRTGDQSVKKLRLYMRQAQNGIVSGWFIVDTISKVDSGIADNTIYRYEFFNSGNYIPADPKFTVLLYDAVPPKANCQALLNGDTISYGGITEGYDWFKSQFSSNLTVDNIIDYNYIIDGVLFFADYNGANVGGQPVVQIFLAGEGTPDPVTGNATTIKNAPSQFFILASSSGTDVSVHYNNGSTDIPTILAGISAAAVSAGWTVASAPTSNSIFLYYPTGTFLLKSTRIENRLNFNADPSYQLALYPQSAYSYGIVYYDQYGRTNGVITDVTANINTFPYSNGLSTTQANITNVTVNLGAVIPPPWAVYYHLVRTNTLTYGKSLYWISNQAFSNVGQLVDNHYAYFGISNIIDYNLSIQATQGVVGYEFAQGDRITVFGKYAVNGGFVSLYFDYSVLGVEVNPIINGTTHLGSFVKIAYPTADIGLNFKFDATAYDFQNYLIFLYNVTSNTATSNKGSTAGQGNVYYEFGQQYFIGNPGTPTAYHFGNFADNQVVFNDGDCFNRQRTIPTGSTFYLYSSAVAFSGNYFTPAIASSPVPTIPTSQYTIGMETPLAADPFNGANYPRFSDGDGLFNNRSGQTFNVRLRGSFTVSSVFVTWISIVCKVIDGSGNVTNPYIVVHSDPVGNSTSIESINITFDGTVEVPAGSKLWLILGNGEVNVGTTNTHFSGFLLRLDAVNNITIDIAEPSFSDIYNLVISNNSRALVQDTTAKTTYFSTLFRYSLNYQVGTTINNTNRFYPNNFDEFDKAKGDIIRMRARQKELRVFQSRRCGRVGIYARFVKNNAGDVNLITTDEIITQNNIQYFEGEYGIGNQPDGLCSSGFRDYFPDPIKGYWCRLSQDGVVPISELYKVQTFAGQNLTNYLDAYNYQFGGNAVILGVYNFTLDRPSEAIFVLQAGTAVSTSTDPQTLIGQAIAFKEEGNAWTSFYDFAPDAMECCENTLYGAQNGILYSHNGATYCNFYGVQYTPSVEIIRNESPAIDKGWIGISLVSSPQWNSPLIYTDTYSYPGQVQESNLVDSDFSLVEGHYRASLLNDLNSIGGISNGQRLKGTLIFMRLTVTDGSKFSYLSTVALKYIASQLVQR